MALRCQGRAYNARSYRMANLPRWKVVLYSLVPLIAVGIVAESVLAVIAYEPIIKREDPYLGFADGARLFVLRNTDTDGPFYETSPAKTRFFSRQSFPAKKASVTRRVFCLGGSTTYGRPYDYRTSFCGWLATYLRDTDKTHDWEVINAGGISYGSHRVVGVLRELAQYEPDLFIIYSGQNEFLERRTYANLISRPPTLTLVDTTLNHTRIYTALKDVVRLAAAGMTDAAVSLAGDEVNTLLDSSIGPDAYHRDDAWHADVLRLFRENLQEMLAIAARSGASAILVAPASNLEDCSPFKSQSGQSLTDDALRSWRAAYDNGREHLLRGTYGKAVIALEKAVAINPRHADSQFRLATALRASGRHAEAYAAFRRARDEDVCPLRILSSMSAVVAEVADATNTPLIDFEALAAKVTLARRGQLTPGRDLFFDHVHPTIDGHRLLGEALFDVMRANSWIPRDLVITDPTRERVAERIYAAVDRDANGVALRNLAKVLSWAGKDKEAATAAEEAVDHLGEDPESLFILGFAAAGEGRWEDSVRLYQRALAVDGGFAKAHNNLAIALAQLGLYGDAISHYQIVLTLDPQHDSAHYNLANAYSKMGQADLAIRHYQSALSANPDDVDAHYNLASVLERIGRPDEAQQHFNEAARVDRSE